MAKLSLSAAIQTDEMTDDIFLKITELNVGEESIRTMLYFLCSKEAASVLSRRKIALAIKYIEAAVFIHKDVPENNFRDSIVSQHILSGDLLFARAFSLLAQSGNNEAFGMMADVICELSVGQMRKEHFAWDVEQTEEDYMNRSENVAKFLAVCCYLGAQTASVSQGQLWMYYDFGLYLGLACQIAEDLQTDVLCQDIKQGIFSLPVLYALHKSAKGPELKTLLLQGDLAAAKSKRVLDILAGVDAAAYASRSMNACLDKAKRSLFSLAPGEAKRNLLQVTEFVASGITKQEISRKMGSWS